MYEEMNIFHILKRGLEVGEVWQEDSGPQLGILHGNDAYTSFAQFYIYIIIKNDSCYV